MERRSRAGIVVAALAGAVVGAAAGWSAHGAAEPPQSSEGASTAGSRAEELQRENRDLRRRLELAKPSRRAAPPEADTEPPRAETRPARAEPAAEVRFQGLVGGLSRQRAVAPRSDLPADVAGLVEALRDGVARGDDGRANGAAQALAALGAAGVDALHRLVADSATSEGVLHRALEVLAGRSAPGLAATVEQLVARPGASSATRSLAMQAAVQADAEPAAGVVQRLLWSSAPADVDLAREALGHAADKAFVPLLREQSQRTDDVRRVPAMLGALAGIKHQRWSAVQLTGEPDTTIGGDMGTAWAPKGEQMGRVWIETDYEVAVAPDLVRVRETFNAGSVVKIEAKLADGSYAALWEGEAAAAETPRWFEPSLSRSPESVRTLRITLDTDKVLGWNEVDAVELIGGGRRQWATAARASSSYSD